MLPLLITKQVSLQLCQKTKDTLRCCRGRVRRFPLQHNITDTELGASRVLEYELSASVCKPSAVFDKHVPMHFRPLCPIRFSADHILSIYIYHFAARHQSIAVTVLLDVP